MADYPGRGGSSLSHRHGVRCVLGPNTAVEDVLIGILEQIGYGNIYSASRMNKVFLTEESTVKRVIEHGIWVSGNFLPISPLVTPVSRVTVSNVPPFISNADTECERSRFGKFRKRVALNCKHLDLKHVMSFRRQVFMFLSEPNMDVSFKVWYERKPRTLYASTGSMRCFECGDIGHKRFSCPHKEQNNEEAEPSTSNQGGSATESQQHNSENTTNQADRTSDLGLIEKDNDENVQDEENKDINEESTNKGVQILIEETEETSGRGSTEQGEAGASNDNEEGLDISRNLAV